MFELKHAGIRKPAAEWGLRALNCTEAHAAEGTFSLGVVVDDARTVEVPFAYGDKVLVYRGTGEVPWFRGYVKATTREGSPVAEGVAVELADVWWLLDALPYLQVQRSLATPGGDPPDPPAGTAEVEILPTTADVYTSRVLLGADPDGAPVSVNAVLAEVISYAADEGVAISLGGLPEADVTIWATSVRDQCCGDILRDMLRWHPDVVAWVNHADGSINFTRRSEAAVTTKVLDGSDDVKSWQVRPRPDLVPAAVALTYHVTDRSNEAEYLRVYEDIAPEGHSGRGPFVVRAAVELRGQSIQTQTQSIRTARIPGNSTVDLDSDEAFEWFKRHVGELSLYSNALIQFASVTATLVPDPLPHPKDPLTRDARTLTSTVTLEDLANELVDGSLDDWGGGKVGRVQVRAKVGYAGGPAAFAALPQEQQDWFYAYTVGGVPYRDVTITVNATNRRSGSKERLTSITAPEPIPVGVAAHYYAAASQLGYEGTVTLTAEEIGATRLLGRVLNLAGGRPEWETMRAQIQQVTYDLTTGTTSVAFGPPPHLGLQDFADLARLGRSNPPSATYKRTSAEISRGERSAGPYIQPAAVVETAPGGRKVLVRNADTDGSKVLIEEGDPAVPKDSYMLRRIAAAVAGSGLPNATVTVDGDKIVIGLTNIPEGLPDGETGDMLIYSGGTWTPLNRPASSGLHVLACTPAGLPYWEDTHACDE